MASDRMSESKTRGRLASFLRRPENSVNVVGLLVAIVLGYWSIRGGSTNQYLQAVLAVLGILTAGQLAVGYSSMLRDREIERLQQSFASLPHAEASADGMFRTRGELLPVEARLLSAVSAVDVLGPSLTTLALTHAGTIKMLAEKGVRMRMIVSNPDIRSLQDALAARLVEAPTGARHARMVRSAIEGFLDCTRSENLQVRITDVFPSFSYFGIDTAEPTGRIDVEFYLCGVAIGRNPIVSLQSSRDPHWYSEFRGQFEAYWKSAKAVDGRPATP